MAYITICSLKYVCPTIAALLILAFTLKDSLKFTHNFHSRLSSTNSDRQTSKLRYEWSCIWTLVNCYRVCYDVCDPRDTRFYNIISEDEALSFKPCKDAKKAASAQHSSLTLLDRKNRTYDIGEEICVLVTMYDGYGKRIKAGGDHLRVTIENKELQASAPCVVTDNKDGTHSVTCEAFWSGASLITVTLAYTRETITTHYRMRKQTMSTRIIYGLYKIGSHQEDVACHPNQTELLKYTNYTELCDLTNINSGMSFYCGKPKNVHLLCQDWEQARFHQPYPDLHLTGCDDVLLKRGQELLKDTLYVKITAGNADKSKATAEKPSIPCSEYNLTLLWQSRRPTGYFYKGKWNLRNCHGFQQNQYNTCLKDRRLYLIGDSTIRAWYPLVMRRFKCQSITEKWDTYRWHKMGECYNKELNFKARWYPHAQPFFLDIEWDYVRYSIYSTSRQIDDIPDNEHAIIVFHLYMHLISFHHRVLRDRLQVIRQSIERLFARNKHSIVMIKGPHTFTNTPHGAVRLCDYFGFVYSKIMYEVFDGLFHRVILLNNKDSTTARHEQWNHPPDDINNYMIDQMLSYACK